MKIVSIMDVAELEKVFIKGIVSIGTFQATATSISNAAYFTMRFKSQEHTSVEF